MSREAGSSAPPTGVDVRPLVLGGEGGKGMIATDLSLKHFLIQGQVKCYRDNQSALTNCLNKMKDFKLPEVKDSMFDPNDNDK